MTGKSEIRESPLSRDFELRASKVFAQFSNPSLEAMKDAKMMWLAWRGDERFVQVHASDLPGLESSWRFYEYTETERLVERFRHVEVRPIAPPFADHVLAFLSVLMQRKVAEGGGARVYSSPVDPRTQGTSDLETKIEETYKRASEGYEVVADWLQDPGGALKSKSVSLSQERFLYLDFVHPKGRKYPSPRGFMYMLNTQDRASTRRRKRALLKWVVFG
jgi:hypothetical protein